ncbi:cyclopropane-fatty-acyl-phospholipid synthase family protein [Williamsia sp. CHRR-6]|uniref:SAM-dependent methyltransferase n=1 Tax=Williamsia sp. CHRR-6 TaxID=2835871 RepID=UPI001BD9441A|nr:cyclopropane-fatty-acyl-phospholipid synthase family protein [Williamsia sp. CHRR-6]MBT0568191.1 class I SAM-dependent methyltransferase [Williamsia sp. CHRR-6]
MTNVADPFAVRRPVLAGTWFKAPIARRLVDYALNRAPVNVLFPDGTVGGNGGPDSETLEIVRPKVFYERLSHNPKIGLGEAYMAGDWRAAEGSDLGAALTPFAERMTTLVPERIWKLRAVVDKRIPKSQRNSVEGSKRNIGAHYDLSNEMFASFLDSTMSYSSAMFDDSAAFAEQDLEQAQYRKIDSILDMAAVGVGSRVLEIGSGWGALAIRAAQRGAHVTTVTLSEEQLGLARLRIAEAGLTDRIDIRLQDYRDVTGQFDAIVSVEMIEAVGEEYWPTYFAKIDELLAPGGIVAIQAILMAHARMMATRRSWGWIQKYIFPGGLIPSLEAIDSTVVEHTTLRRDDRIEIGKHYAETLRRWRHRFNDSWGAFSHKGFDETFRRMWEYYLAYCEAGFESGYLQVSQLRFTRP